MQKEVYVLYTEKLERYFNDPPDTKTEIIAVTEDASTAHDWELSAEENYTAKVEVK